MEIWKNITKTNGDYQVSSIGNVRSVDRIQETSTKSKERKLKGVVFKKEIVRAGYYCVTIRINKKRSHEFIHRLVAIEFIPNPENKPEVNHIDGDPKNNKVENLEWVTPSENKLHSYKSLNRGYPLKRRDGKFNPNSKPVYKICKLTGTIIDEFGSLGEAKRKTGIDNEQIRCVCLGIKNYKSAGGFYWKFK